ncbi:flavin-containing amine oxidoreductase-domain containing protein [Ilyonectria destructans]|nr:flavin-containing amine oxidoreductase-domain containing protein [Ilyonectria destructans]
MGGNSLDELGLLDALRWWSLGFHRPTGLNDIALHTHLGSGNSELHRRIFDHAVSTGRPAYRFDAPITQIQDFGGPSLLQPEMAKSMRQRMFDPLLPVEKPKAIREGSVNKCNKIHLDTEDPDLLPWSSFSSPGSGMVCAFGDNNTPSGKSHLVAFGPPTESATGVSLENIEATRSSVISLLHKDLQNKVSVSRIVAHDWTKDEFAKGTWYYLPPKFTTRYLETLQRVHGNIHFASADWSDGWRGWIDGAVQAGMQAAHRLIQLQSHDVDRQSTRKL